MGREQKIQAEATALWRQLYDQPPPSEADGSMILDLIMRDLPDASYARLQTVHLRPTAITFPRPEES